MRRMQIGKLIGGFSCPRLRHLLPAHRAPADKEPRAYGLALDPRHVRMNNHHAILPDRFP